MKTIGIPEIAKLANVTIGTVDRALHGRKGISESTRERILEIARNVRYRPNLAARALSAGNNPIRIGVCIPQEIHYYFDQLRFGILSEAQRVEHFGVHLTWRMTERLGSGEAGILSELIRTELAAIILTPGDPERVRPLIEQAEQQNIRVICVDTDISASQRSTVVCVDPEISGGLAAELMGSFVPPGSEVAVVTGMLFTEDHRRKTQGFCEAFSSFSKGSSVVEVVEAHEDEEEAFQKCYALLKRRRGLTGVYVNTVNCLPVCRAVGALGLAAKIKLITTDLFREMQPYFEKGVISASIYARPFVQGQVALRLAVDHLLRGSALPKNYYLTPQIVMRSTFHLFRETRNPEGVAGGVELPAREAIEGEPPQRVRSAVE